MRMTVSSLDDVPAIYLRDEPKCVKDLHQRRQGFQNEAHHGLGSSG